MGWGKLGAARAQWTLGVLFTSLIVCGAGDALAASSTTTIQSSVNPSSYGQSVTFTATVSGSSGGAPNGEVQFKDGADPLGSAVTLNTLGVGQSIANGGNHTCALTAAGGVKCWGYNQFGQLGDNSFTDRSSPVDVVDSGGTPLVGFTAVTAGSNHTCALTTAGGIKCWGRGIVGILGNNDTSDSKTPVDVVDSDGSPLIGFKTVAAGSVHTCALTEAGGVKCWGYNRYGQLGNSTNSGLSTANPIPLDTGLTGVVAITAGEVHTCALTSTGEVKCWGQNTSGQLGSSTNSGTAAITSTPFDTGLTGIVAIDAGAQHTCALTLAGEVKCWGDNQWGQLGSSTNIATPAPNPTPISTGITGVAAITAGGFYTCALTAAGGIKCWGYNALGQLGSSTNSGISAANPSPLDSGLTGIVAIAAGGSHSCALTAAGGLQCWGSNFYGQLGSTTNNGTNTANPTPAAVTNFGAGSGLVYGEAKLPTSALTAGDHSITAVYSGDGNHTTSTSDPLTQTVNKADQTVRFISFIPASLFVGADFDFTYAASSPLPVDVTVSGPCTFDGSITVHMTGTGDCTLILNQAGDASYNAAPEVTRTITIDKADQTIGFSAAPGSAKVGGGYTPGATASSGLAVTFGASGACSYSGGTVSFTAAGTCTVTANQSGNSNYNAAPQATQSFNIDKGDQTVSFDSSAPSAAKIGGNYTPAATATSGLAATFGASGSCSLSSSAVHFDSTGSCTVTANQSGNSNYNAAPQVTQSFSIGKATSMTRLRSQFSPSQFGKAVTLKALVSGSSAGAPTGSVEFSNGASTLGFGTVGLPGASLSLATGNAHTCALTATSGVQCWGQNVLGQLGSSPNSGTLNPNPTPLDTGLSGIVAIAAGTFHTCALTANGAVECWGYNYFGQLGSSANIGTANPNPNPIDTGLSGVVAVTAGYYHTCVLTANGGVQCWGLNGNGQLGAGTTNNSSAPVAVTGLSSVSAIAAGFYHTCALIADGSVHCWGLNDRGQLGDGTTMQSSTPVAVTGLSGVVAIAAGGAHTCALIADGSVHCWGLNDRGQLGDGTTMQSSTPVAVSGLSDAVTIAARYAHTCAQAADGGVHCWGLNNTGQLGDGTTNDSYTPTNVGLSGTNAVTAGALHTCAMIANGSIQCWGSNEFGQLGDGSTTQRNSPVGVSSFSAGAALVFGEAKLTTSALAVGDRSLTAAYSGDDNHDGSTSAALAQSVGKADQTITFDTTAPTSIQAGAIYAPSATASSGLAVSLGASGACSFSAGDVTFTGAGTCTVTANQSGDGNTNAAPQATQVITVLKTTPTVTLSASPNPATVGNTITFTATMTDDGVNDPAGTVTFNFSDSGASDAVTVAGHSAQITRSASASGSYTVTANYSGNSNFNGATSSSVTVNVNKSAQTITFTSTPPAAKVGGSYTPAATASSGLAVTFSASGACSFAGGKVTFNSAGTCTVKANQAGNATYAVAPQKTQSIAVGKAATTLALAASPATAKPGQAVTLTATLGATPSSLSLTGSVTFKDGATPLGSATVASRKASLATSALTIGSHTITATYNGDAKVAGSSANQTVTVTAAAGSQGRANTTTAGAQQLPAVTALASGYAMVWVSAGQDKSGGGIYLQRRNADGTKAGSETRVNTTTAGDQSQPAIASLKSGFLVAWQSAGTDKSGLGIYAQRYSSTGGKAGGEFKVNTTTTGDQSAPAVAGLSDGGFVVAWVSNGSAGSDIYAQRYDSKWTAAGAQFRVNKTTTGTQSMPAVAGLSGCGFVVAWQGPDADGTGIYMQRYSAAGKALGSETRVNSVTLHDQSLPTIAATSNGGYVIAWQSALQDGSGLGVYQQVFTAGGGKVDSNHRVATASANDQATPALAALRDGGFVAAWMSKGQDGSGQGIYVHAFKNDGTRVNTEFRANTTTTGDQTQPAVAALTAGNFLAAWTSAGDGSSVGVYFQRFIVPDTK